MSVAIEIDLVRLEAKPPLRALADVRLLLSEGELRIRRCAVFERDGQPPWASLPRIAFSKNGKKQYVPVLDLPHGLKKQVLEALLKQYQENS